VKNCLDWYITKARMEAERVRFYSASSDLDNERINHALQYCLDEIERAIVESFKDLEKHG
jgi:hypothetical protein